MEIEQDDTGDQRGGIEGDGRRPEGGVRCPVHLSQ